jgi:hypothetical protein
MSAILAVPVPVEVMAMARAGGAGGCWPPVGFDVQGPAVPGIDVVRGGHCGALGDEPADLAYRVGRSPR